MRLSTTLKGLAFLAALAPALFAAPQDFQRKYEEKLKKSFVRHGGWETDFDIAKERAQKEDKLIFTYFSRSYAP